MLSDAAVSFFAQQQQCYLFCQQAHISEPFVPSKASWKELELAWEVVVEKNNQKQIVLSLDGTVRCIDFFHAILFYKKLGQDGHG